MLARKPLISEKSIRDNKVVKHGYRSHKILMNAELVMRKRDP